MGEKLDAPAELSGGAVSGRAQRRED